ncbi:MAG TPA: FtsX-like permease family protein [Blastocatellia bacterium]|nr:FtsX-like permease family protein [Blastocatellia bacterium]
MLILITIRQWRANKVRTLLTLLGIASGVALSFSMQTGNAVLVNSLQQTILKLAGKATLQVSAGDPGFPEDVLKVVRSTDGVKLAEPVIEAVARPTSEDAGNILIIGLDISSSPEIHEYQFEERGGPVSDSLEFISHHDSILITSQFAQDHNLGEHDKLELYTSQGPKEFTVRGIIKGVGAGEIFGGHVAVMDIYSAQYVFDRGANIDRIDVMTDPDAGVEPVRDKLVERLGPGFEVSRPAARGQDVEYATATIRQGYLISSLVALLVGAFIIFNSLNTAVTQRRHEIGTLRALGVERRYIQLMFLVEAALFGMIGAVLGVVGGFYLALIARATSISSTMYQHMVVPPSPSFSLEYAFTSAGLGLAASLVAAWFPARAASRLDPVLALRNVETVPSKYPFTGLRFTAGTLSIIASLLLIRFTTPHVGLTLQLSYAALTLFGFIIMLPDLSEWIARALRPIMDRAFGSEGLLAIDAIIESPKRTSATVAALMISLAFVFSTWAFIQSQKSSIVKSFDRLTNSDLFVFNHGRTYSFPEGLGPLIGSLPGISRVESARFVSVPYGGHRVGVLALDTSGFFARVESALEEGDEDEARELMPKGEGVLLAGNFSSRWGLQVGDLLKLDTPNGTLIRPVLGILNDFSAEKGTIYLDRGLYKTYWQDSGVDFFNISLNIGADRGAVKRQLQQLLAGEHQAFVFTNVEYRERMLGVVDRFFQLTYLQMVITIFVAVIGIINTLIVSVVERKREIGIIRAIGALRGQIRKMIVLESIAIAITGLTLGGMKSLVDTYFMVHTAAAVILGYSLPYHWPTTAVFLAVPVVTVVAAIAASWPANRALNMEVNEAIGVE